MLARVRRSRISAVLVTAAAIAAGVLTASAAAAQPAPGPATKKTIAVIHCDYPPVSFWDKNTDTPSGFFVDLMEVIARRAGLRVTYICESGWPEMLNAIESGKADLGALMKSAEREKRLLFTNPIEMTYLSFFVRSQSGIADDASLEGHVVGVIKGSMSFEQLKSRPGITLRPKGSYQEGIFSLLAGEIELFAGEEAMILKQARETGLEDRIRKVGKPFNERERGIAVRKNDTRLLALLNGALPGFIGSPPYQKIYLEWYGKPAPFWTANKILALSGLLSLALVCGMAFWRYRSITKLNAELTRNIAERKHIEEALRESEAMMRRVLNNVDEGFIVVDKEYRILTANRAYCDQVGADSGQVIGKRCFEVSHRIPRPCHEVGEDCAVRRVFETGEPCVASHTHHQADGHVLYVETRAFPLIGEAGEITSVIESITNITGKHLLEQERLKAQKLESIGTLAGGIAHDFNNLLQGVFGYISLARLKCDDREEGLAALAEAEKALQLSVKLTNQLLTFSKGGKPAKKPTRLRPTVESAVKFALSGSRSGNLVTGVNLWPVDADEGQIGQVIQNIVLNADQAMPDGGMITVSMRNIEAHAKDLPPGLAAGNYVEIAIADTGDGIPEHLASRIFDPYFTTKEKGSGLGLATSYSIIKNHNGLITMKSEPGSGTTFFLYLPATEESCRDIPAAAATATGSATGRKKRILLMDDEEVVRNVTGELIGALGHEVEFAAHGEETLAKYGESLRAGRVYDVVILDLTIKGGLGGSETLRRLLQIDRDVTAVVSSGYSDDAVTSRYSESGFKAFLKKPYSIDQLQSALESAIST